MPDQVNYYNDFGKRFEDSIMNCPEPEFWTTDYMEKGRVYQEMKRRVSYQLEFADKQFTKKYKVLDLGCGFGRQAIALARAGFDIAGIDTSDTFIQIAKKLFEKNRLQGAFYCIDILKEKLPSQEKFAQIILFDVLEHIAPWKRRAFMKTLYELSLPSSQVLISLPRVKQRFTSKLNNRVRRRVTQHLPFFFKKEEHPYIIPEKPAVARLSKGLFRITDFVETNDTGFYALKKID
jgi:2-polyprenyl-3-methyl-5-hydroxy-6-metoxy-1,4-benzoquinol methylase